MDNHAKPTHEHKLALVQGAKERMIGRARSWLQDSKVKAALSKAPPLESLMKKAS